MVCSITYTGPLMMSAIIMFISAMYSCRSGCGRSSSEELIDKKKHLKKKIDEINIHQNQQLG